MQPDGSFAVEKVPPGDWRVCLFHITRGRGGAGLYQILPVTEISGLQAGKTGADIDLSWVDQTSTDPCVLYRVYVATNAAPSDPAAFVVEATATLPGWIHRNAFQDTNAYWYLVTSISPIVGEGPRGHHGQ